MIDHFKEKDVKEFVLLDEKWSMLKEMKYVLGIAYEATVAMQNQQLTLSELYGIWTVMELHLKKCVQTKFKTDIAKQLEITVIGRRDHLFDNPFMSSALYLDPRYHRQIMQNREKVEAAKQTLLNLWHRINDNSDVTHDDAPNNTSTESTGSINLDFDPVAEMKKYFAGSNLLEIHPTNETNDIELVIDLYDPEPMEFGDEMKVVDYWEKEKEKQPQLYKLASIVFSIPPCETQIERDFSRLDYVFNDRRCSLTEERLEDIMIINLNPQLFDIVKEEELKELGDQIK